MARRRLHGETQKKRKKKLTQALKRRDSITRTTSTQQPAEFERAGEVVPEDIEFLEAMDEMGVRRLPRQADAPARIEIARKVTFETNQNQDLLFAASMEFMGVKPLDGTQKNSSFAPASKSPQKAGNSPKGDVNTGIKPSIAREATRKVETPPPKEPVKQKSHPTVSSGEFTRFELEDDPETMADILAQAEMTGQFDLAKKYEGAPPPAASKAPQALPGMPDSELDLHGKTQEEAIRMVTNFLMTTSRQRLRHVLIITGKGNRSGPGGPVLRTAVQHWLERNGKSFVKGFRPAPPEHGGDGAIWVELR